MDRLLIQMIALRVYLSLLIVLIFCTACGVKGPLYLPEKRYPQPGKPTGQSIEPIQQTDPSE
jgi:predicted small lipoprotein YifL